MKLLIFLHNFHDSRLKRIQFLLQIEERSNVLKQSDGQYVPQTPMGPLPQSAPGFREPGPSYTVHEPITITENQRLCSWTDFNLPFFWLEEIF